MIIVFLTAFTLIAFAANSLLCRMALGASLIDPVSFTTIRLVSGALVLLPIARQFGESKSLPVRDGSWSSGAALFLYAATFSLAYVSINTGIGALILFGSVQITMLGAALRSGERLRPAQWLGTIAAIGGLAYLVFPGISAPDPLGALLMCVSGIAWGVYSIRGKGVSAPIAMTAGNFLRSAPLALVIAVFALSKVRAEPAGVVLALISGAITSGMGYILWYAALRHLTTVVASIVQLLVPVLAAFGGVVFLSERISMRLIVASTLILGGVGFAVVKSSTKVVTDSAIE